MTHHVVETTWTNDDWDKFTEWLKGMLYLGPVTITFTKKDGTERVMKCTLDPKELPEQVVTENKKERKQSDTSLAVYDLEAKGWRSFIIKSVTKVNLTLE